MQEVIIVIVVVVVLILIVDVIVKSQNIQIHEKRRNFDMSLCRIYACGAIPNANIVDIVRRSHITECQLKRQTQKQT